MAGNGLDAGDSIRGSDKFRFFRGWNTDQSAGERDVPFRDLVTYLNSSDSGLNTSTVSQAEIDNLQYNIGVNSLRDAVNGGYAYFNMVDGVGDVYTDETGVNTGGSTNANYDVDGDYYTSTIDPDPATLLIQSETTDGSTTFTDAAGAKTVTANGNVQHDTDQAQFGSSSILFDGTGDSLSLADDNDWTLGTGDFTIDFWMRTNSVTGNNALFSQWGGAASINSIFLYLAGAEVNLNTVGPSGVGTFDLSSSSTPITINTWHHIAVVRNGTTFTIYVDGTSVATNTDSIDINAVAEPLVIGGSSGIVSGFEGHMEEFRWLKGTAVWTSNFTPPAAPYDATGASGDMTLVSTTFTAQSAPSNARVVALWEPVVASTLGTDYFIDVSRDGGTTWTTFTMTQDAEFSTDVDILTSDNLDISSQPSGTSMVYRVRTANSKNIRQHGTYLQWS